jgi:Tol biopolymer transport system component
MRFGIVAVICLLIGTGLQGCNYSKSYFRIGPDGKKIKADGPIVPGEEIDGEATAGTATGGTDGGGTGGDGTITPTGGVGTGGATAGGATAGGVTGIPVYPLAIHAEDRANDAHNLYLARFSEGAFLETPKKLTSNDDSTDGAILFPSLSPDASKILYFAAKGTGSIFDGTFDMEGGLHLISDLQGTPADAAWNASDPGISASWTADGQEAVYLAGGCGLIRKAKSGGTDAVTEGNQPSGDYDKWIYFQTSASPVKDALHPAFGTILFSMVSADESIPEAKLGADLFLKKAGDADPAHYTAVTETPMVLEAYPSISPDGKYILFASLALSGSGGSGDAPQKITVCDLVAGKCQNTRTFDAMPAGSVNSSPCWAWDSSRIFFSSKDPATKKYDLFMLEFTGGVFGASATNITNTADLDEMEVSCASAPSVK